MADISVFFYFSKYRKFFRPKKFSALRAECPPRNAITKYTSNKTKFISGVVKTARRRLKFWGFGNACCSIYFEFAIQMWTFAKKSDFFQIRNTGNFSGLGEEHFFQIRNTGKKKHCFADSARDGRFTGTFISLCANFRRTFGVRTEACFWASW